MAFLAILTPLNGIIPHCRQKIWQDLSIGFFGQGGPFTECKTCFFVNTVNNLVDRPWWYQQFTIHHTCRMIKVKDDHYEQYLHSQGLHVMLQHSLDSPLPPYVGLLWYVHISIAVGWEILIWGRAINRGNRVIYIYILKACSHTRPALSKIATFLQFALPFVSHCLLWIQIPCVWFAWLATKLDGELWH